MPEAEQGMNVARIGALLAGLPYTVPGVTINRFCSSGVQAIAMAADRIQLVDEDDARSFRLGLLEEVADSRGPDAHEHLDEVRARDREERHLGLAGDGLGQQGLTGAG